jgi:predicted ATPase
MIEKIKIKGFKRFSEAEFALSPLTILAGMNGAGKTSVIHALLLLQEATRSDNSVVELNGPYSLDLGTFSDIQNWNTTDSIQFMVAENGINHHWKLTGSPSARYADIVIKPNIPPIAFNQKGRAFQYLSAERFGPRSVLGSSALPLEMIEVGTRGEFSAQVIYSFGKESILIPDLRRSPDSRAEDDSLLKSETERWLSRIARSVQIDTEILAGTAVTALRFRTPNGDWVRPPNMGFGVTYSLPVILAGLTAKEGGLLIVENPEAHLHPSGQSQMGYFLAKIAAAGVQVVVETHSDHVLNGIRRAIGDHRALPASQAIVHFFDTDNAPETLTFTETGGVAAWPRGFFDQFQLDVAALTRVRRPR